MRRPANSLGGHRRGQRWNGRRRESRGRPLPDIPRRPRPRPRALGAPTRAARTFSDRYVTTYHLWTDPSLLHLLLPGARPPLRSTTMKFSAVILALAFGTAAAFQPFAKAPSTKVR